MAAFAVVAMAGVATSPGRAHAGALGSFVSKLGHTAKVRIDGAAWNVARFFTPTHPVQARYTLKSLAGARTSVLRKLMQQGTAPTMEELTGSWQGLNKGTIASLAGFGAFTKVMQQLPGSTGGALGQGYNQVDVQVTPDQWVSGGWKPVLDALGRAKRRGFFEIDTPDRASKRPNALRLDYSRRDNGSDPAGLLRDSIVRLDDTHLLGRADVRLGPLTLPAGYFILERTKAIR